MVNRLKRAARLERALRYVAMYLISAILVLILTAPFWVPFVIWRE